MSLWNLSGIFVGPGVYQWPFGKPSASGELICREDHSSLTVGGEQQSLDNLPCIVSDDQWVGSSRPWAVSLGLSVGPVGWEHYALDCVPCAVSESQWVGSSMPWTVCLVQSAFGCQWEPRGCEQLALDHLPSVVSEDQRVVRM